MALEELKALIDRAKAESWHNLELSRRGIQEVPHLPGADLFDTKTPVSEVFTFFGRETLLQQLEENLQNLTNIGLFGPRKTGKTSVLKKLLRTLKAYPVVYIDLQKVGSKTYAIEIFNLILRELTQLANDAQPNPSNLLSQLTTRKLRIPTLPNRSRSNLTDPFTSHVLRLDNILKERGYQMPILCFLDEMECVLPRSEADAEEFNTVFGVLRALNQQHNCLSLLVVDAHPDCNRINHWPYPDIRTNPVFSFFQEIFLPPFPLDDTRFMIHDIAQLMGRIFEPDVLTRIHEQSGGYPLIARQLASLLHKKVTQDPITLDNSNPYLTNPFRYSGFLKDYFQELWKDLEHREFHTALIILRAVALAPDQHLSYQTLLDQHSLTESQSLDAILWLEAVGLIQRTQNLSTLILGLPLLTCWLHMQFTPEELKPYTGVLP